LYTRRKGIHIYIRILEEKIPLTIGKRETSPWHCEANNPLGVIKRLIILYDEKEEVFFVMNKYL
jgi:hypothetical protein